MTIHSNEKTIILLVGLMGSGKTELAKKYIKDYNHEKFSFADEVRSQSFLFLGHKPKDYDNFKARLLYLDRLPTAISKILKYLFRNWLYGREYLQNIGHGQRKLNGDRYWINKTIDKIKQSNNPIVIDDCRYKNELTAIHDFAKDNDYRLEIRFCDYRSKKYNDKSKHSTEQLAIWLRDNFNLPHDSLLAFFSLDGYNSYSNLYDIIIKKYKGE